MALQLTRDNGIVISDERSRLDVDRIAGWLAESYWAHDRDRPTIERSLEHSYPIGAYAPDGTQIAFSRAVTDFASFAWIADVVVDPQRRGRGIGTALVQALVDELRAHGIQRFVLGTRDAHGVYERIGFTSLRIPEIWMEIDERRTRAERADANRGL